uniref:Uncharacterized protein n=1 Tax=Anguilla anguilla TaxID=7936 RepID=A0A0E9PA06_ANGAN
MQCSLTWQTTQKVAHFRTKRKVT